MRRAENTIQYNTTVKEAEDQQYLKHSDCQLFELAWVLSSSSMLGAAGFHHVERGPEEVKPKPTQSPHATHRRLSTLFP